VSEQLSWQRLALVLRNDVMRSYRAVLVVSGTVALVALAISLADAYDRIVEDVFYRVFFIGAMFAWGTIATSLSFTDLHGRATNASFLLLPASALEKTLSRLLVTTVGLVVYLLLLTTVLSWLLEGINTLLFEVRREVFSPLDRVAWMLVPHYLATQALFFLGAAWFRKAHYVKTVGAVLAIVFALSAVAAGIIWVFGAAPWNTGVQFDDGLGSTALRPIEWLIDAAPWAYFFALPVFCWFVAWLRVTETQVSHGI
jgi:hypothetical protein